MTTSYNITPCYDNIYNTMLSFHDPLHVMMNAQCHNDIITPPMISSCSVMTCSHHCLFPITHPYHQPFSFLFYFLSCFYSPRGHCPIIRLYIVVHYYLGPFALWQSLQGCTMHPLRHIHDTRSSPGPSWGMSDCFDTHLQWVSGGNVGVFHVLCFAFLRGVLLQVPNSHEEGLSHQMSCCWFPEIKFVVWLGWGWRCNRDMTRESMECGV